MALLQSGATAPDFKGLNLTGQEFSLSGLKGQKAVILLFAPDQITPPMVNPVKAAYDKNRAEIEFVTLARKLPGISMAKMFLQSMGVKFPVIYDQKEEVYKLYGVEKPIVLYAIDKQGNIANVIEADPKGLNPQILQEAIDKVKEGPVGSSQEAGGR